MTKLLTTLLLALSLTAYAQPGCALRQVTFYNGANSDLYKKSTDNLAIILVDGFLKGKLVAYKVAPLDSAIRKVDLQPLTARDMVMLEGTTPTKSSETKNNQSLKKVKITAADLKPLSKMDFLREMAVDGYDEPGTWKKSIQYEESGYALHNGLGYRAIKASVGIPPPNKAYWELVSNGNLPYFFPIPDLAGFSIFGQYEVADSKKGWKPLLIRLTRTAEVPTYLVDMAVSFKYADVINYLRTIAQPLLYNSSSGYLDSGQFVLEGNVRESLKESVRQQISKDSVFKSAFKISDEARFDAWLQKKNPPYTFHLHPSGKEFRLLNDNVLVASVPANAVSRSIAFAKPELRTWSQSLERNSFRKFEAKLEGMVADLPSDSPAPPSVGELVPTFLLERYTVNTIEGPAKTQLYKTMAQLLKLVNAQFKAGALPLAEEKESYFPAKFDWSTIPEIKARTGVKPAYLTNMLHHDDVTHIDYPYYWYDNSNLTYLHKRLSPMRADSLEFGVTYKRSLANKTTTFQPFQVSISPLQPSGKINGRLPRYTFNWIDLRRVAMAGGDPLLKQLVDGIEKGSILFTDSYVLYGLMEQSAVKSK